VHDSGTPGTSTGSTATVSSPALDGQARQLVITWTGSGGERYSVSGGPSVIDPNSTKVVYSVSMYTTDNTNFNQVETDVNQVISNGHTIIYGFQCSIPTGKYEYTINSGGSATWVASSVPCTRAQYSINTWHTFSFSAHRVGETVTYDQVCFDGTCTALGNSGANGFALGWTPIGLFSLNFQITGTQFRRERPSIWTR